MSDNKYFDFFSILSKLNNLEHVVSAFRENVSFNLTVKYDSSYKNRIQFKWQYRCKMKGICLQDSRHAFTLKSHRMPGFHTNIHLLLVFSQDNPSDNRGWKCIVAVKTHVHTINTHCLPKPLLTFSYRRFPCNSFFFLST